MVLVWLVESAVLTAPSVKAPVAKDFSRYAASPCLPEALTTLSTMLPAVGCKPSTGCGAELMLLVDAGAAGESAANRLCTMERTVDTSMMLTYSPSESSAKPVTGSVYRKTGLLGNADALRMKSSRSKPASTATFCCAT